MIVVQFEDSGQSFYSEKTVYEKKKIDDLSNGKKKLSISEKTRMSPFFVCLILNFNDFEGEDFYFKTTLISILFGLE
jgi:hypothetical protein